MTPSRIAPRIALPLIAFVGVVVVAVVLAQRTDPPRILLEGLSAAIVTTDGTPTVAVFATIRNEGGPDRLTGAASPDAKLAMLAGEEDLTGLPIPAGGAPSLAMDGAHVMLMGVGDAPEEGRLIPLTLTFERAGEIAAKARVTTPGAAPAMAGAADADGAGERGAGMDGHAMGGDAGGDAGGETGGETGGDGVKAMDHAAMMASFIDLPAAAAPEISLKAAETAEGWRISLEADRFRFAPEAMDGPHVAGEGHGHLYIGGLKIMRMTTPEVEIGALPPGRHVLRVTLNANDHRPYRADDAPVSAETVIEAR